MLIALAHRFEERHLRQRTLFDGGKEFIAVFKCAARLPCPARRRRSSCKGCALAGRTTIPGSARGSITTRGASCG